MINKDVSVLILSCDTYTDVWNPFFTLFFKYWNCPYSVYIATESKKCNIDRVKTISHNYSLQNWTDRIRETLNDIDSKYILMMDGDFFLRKKVRQDVINECVTWLDENNNAAVFNFEKEYSNELLECKYKEFGKKKEDASYRHSCQPGLWSKEKLKQLLQESKSPWEWELTNARNDFEYYIYNGIEDNLVFDYGYRDHNRIGIRNGKWVMQDVIPLFAKEGIAINYLIRGFC